MREIFEIYRPKAETAKILHRIIAVVEDYSRQGFTLTLRQLYYQLVSKDLISNDERQYKRIGDIVSRARRGGLLDWNALEDRVRVPQKPSEFNDLDDLMEVALGSYRLPRLKGQKLYTELWVEKDALAGVLAPIASAYHITLMVNRGYSSTSAMKSAGDRVRAACELLGCDRAVILYLGDLDPSGEDMVRDVEDRLNDYVNHGSLVEIDADTKDVHVEEDEDRIRRKSFIGTSVIKVALTMEQVQEFDPPPNPAKLSDSRAAKYIAENGSSSWEVDALPPRELRNIIEATLDELVDVGLMDKIKEQEEKDKVRLRKAFKSLKRSK